MTEKLIILAVILGATTLSSCVMWAHHRRIAPANVTDELREQRKLAQKLGSSPTARVTVNPRLLGHQDVVDLAAAHGYATTRWYPAESGELVYDFECRVLFPPPCAMASTSHWGRG
ncbi:hypothetical protein OG216_17165 [Streptomycetaceae bacterium NBC_01309]